MSDQGTNEVRTRQECIVRLRVGLVECSSTSYGIGTRRPDINTCITRHVCFINHQHRSAASDGWQTEREPYSKHTTRKEAGSFCNDTVLIQCTLNLRTVKSSGSSLSRCFWLEHAPLLAQRRSTGSRFCRLPYYKPRLPCVTLYVDH